MAPRPLPEEQAYFNRTIRHLYDQGRRAADEVGACRYRIGKLRCAVGVHIPDKHPALELIGGIATLRGRHPELAGIAWPNTERGLSLAACLQWLHDEERHWDEQGFIGWHEARLIGRRHFLDTSVVDALELAARELRDV